MENNKIRIKDYDQYKMPIADCEIIKLNNDFLKCRITLENDCHEYFHIPLYGDEDSMVVYFQWIAKRYNCKLNLINGIKFSVKNYKDAEKIVEILSKEIQDCGTYLKYVSFNTNAFWSAWDNNIDYTKIPLDILMEHLKKYDKHFQTNNLNISITWDRLHEFPRFKKINTIEGICLLQDKNLNIHADDFINKLHIYMLCIIHDESFKNSCAANEFKKSISWHVENKRINMSILTEIFRKCENIDILKQYTQNKGIK